MNDWVQPAPPVPAFTRAERQFEIWAKHVNGLSQTRWDDNSTFWDVGLLATQEITYWDISIFITDRWNRQ